MTFPIVPPVNCWSSEHAAALHDKALELLAYRSHLLGADPSVANWGGGNTSSKTTEIDFRDRPTRVLWVKGSGSNLGTIRPEQFTGLRLDDLVVLVEREAMSDEELVRYYEHAVLRPGEPRASIETPLHSMLPFEHVDHTHPDAIIALCAVPEGASSRGGSMAIGPSGLTISGLALHLGKQIALAVREQPDATCVLMAKHGLVTWGETSEACYAATIQTIARAAEALAEHADRRLVFAVGPGTLADGAATLTTALPALRGAISRRRSMVLRVNTSPAARAFTSRPDLAAVASAGPACPDHLVHTKPWPMLIPAEAVSSGPQALARSVLRGVTAFEKRYKAYLRAARDGGQMLDPAPRVVLVPGLGVVATGADAAQAGSPAPSTNERSPCCPPPPAWAGSRR